MNVWQRFHTVNITPGLPVCAVIMVSGFIYTSQIPGGIFNGKDIWFILGTGIVCCIASCIAQFKKHKKLLEFNAIDLLAVLFLLYVLLNASIFKKAHLPVTVRQMTTLCILTIYLVLNYWKQRDKTACSMLLILFAITGIVQVVIGLLQCLNIVQGHNSVFTVTGFFINPAPYAIYISVLAVFSYVVLLFLTSRGRKYWQLPAVTFFLGCSIFLLVQTGSRSSWVATFFVILFTTILYGCKYHPAYIARVKKKFALLSLLFLPLAGYAGYMLYCLKSVSADGRLLTWRISFNILQAHPVSGVGFDNFATAYMNYQHDYFLNKQGAISRYGFLAGDIRYAFNDLLQILVEGGVIGGLLFLAMISMIFWGGIRSFLFFKYEGKGSTRKQVLLLFALGGMAAILIAGLSSYPLSMLPLHLLFWLLAALVSGLQVIPGITFSTNASIPRRVVSAVLLLTGIAITAYAVNRRKMLINWQECKRKNEEKSLSGKYSGRLYRLYPALADNGIYMIGAGKAFLNDSNYSKAIEMLNEAKEINPYKDIYYSLGKAYQASGEFEKAEEQYRFVSYSIPNLIEPYYLLAKLYYGKGELNRFMATARIIKAYNPKIANPQTAEMKREISWLLYKEEMKQQVNGGKSNK